jgi:hypothetical protein
LARMTAGPGVDTDDDPWTDENRRRVDVGR